MVFCVWRRSELHIKQLIYFFTGVLNDCPVTTISFKAALAARIALMSTGELVKTSSLNGEGSGGGVLVGV